MAVNEDDGLTADLDYPRTKEELEKYFKKTYKFTQKERRVLGECYDEAFNTRGVPMGIGFAIIIELAVRKGLIKPPRSLGALSTALIGGACGVFLGMFSATNACYDKLRQSPESMYGRYLQYRKYGKFDFDYEPTRLRGKMDSVSSGASDQFLQPNVLNLDFERPDVKELDDFRRFPNDETEEDMRDNEQLKPFVSYAELRQRNRDAYAKTTESRYDRLTSNPGPVKGDSMRQVLRAEPKMSTKSEQSHSSAETNKYGDVWPT